MTGDDAGTQAMAGTGAMMTAGVLRMITLMVMVMTVVVMAMSMLIGISNIPSHLLAFCFSQLLSQHICAWVTFQGLHSVWDLSLISTVPSRGWICKGATLKVLHLLALALSVFNLKPFVWSRKGKVDSKLELDAAEI